MYWISFLDYWTSACDGLKYYCNNGIVAMMVQLWWYDNQFKKESVQSQSHKFSNYWAFSFQIFPILSQDERVMVLLETLLTLVPNIDTVPNI